MTFSSSGSSTRRSSERLQQCRADLLLAQAQAAERELSHGDPFFLPERARQAPVEDGQPAVGGHEQVPRVGIGVERGLGCGRPDRAGDQCLDDQLGEPPPIGRPMRPRLGHLVSVDSLHGRDAARAEGQDPGNQDLGLVRIGLRGLAKMALLSFEVDLGPELLANLVEDLAIIQGGDPERRAPLIEEAADVLEQARVPGPGGPRCPA